MCLLSSHYTLIPPHMPHSHSSDIRPFVSTLFVHRAAGGARAARAAAAAAYQARAQEAAHAAAARRREGEAGPDPLRADAAAAAKGENLQLDAGDAKTSKKRAKTSIIFWDIWEEWGRHIWEKRVVGIVWCFFQNHSFLDIWEKWGRHIWGKRVVWILSCFEQKEHYLFGHMGETGSPQMRKKGCWGFFVCFCPPLQLGAGDEGRGGGRPVAARGQGARRDGAAGAQPPAAQRGAQAHAAAAKG